MGIFRNRRRTRFRDLPDRAKATMNNADLLIEAVRAVVGELADGVTITLVKKAGELSLLNILTSKDEVSFPIGVRVELSEEPEE